MKQYYITKYVIRKQNYDLQQLEWLEGFHKDYFEPLQLEEFTDKKEALKEFEENYKHDDYNEDYVYHFELEENDTVKEEIETVCSSKPNIDYICENIYTEIENELIRKAYFSDNENDDIIEELIDNQFSSGAYDKLLDIKTDLITEICDKLTDRKQEILEEIESRIHWKFIHEFDFSEDKLISLCELEDFCRDYNLENLDYNQLIDECDNKSECVAAYSISFNSDYHIYIKFDFTNYDNVKDDRDDFLEESKLKIKDIYLS